MHWKSNAKTELRYYGIDQKKNTRISEAEINVHIAEAFAEMDDDDDSDDSDVSNEASTCQKINGEAIPPDNCVVLIEEIWIDKFVDLSHNLIINAL